MLDWCKIVITDSHFEEKFDPFLKHLLEAISKHSRLFFLQCGNKEKNPSG